MVSFKKGDMVIADDDMGLVLEKEGPIFLMDNGVNEIWHNCANVKEAY